jgi:pimeloyl-ACP methyl ester carboxylesterase
MYTSDSTVFLPYVIDQADKGNLSLMVGAFLEGTAVTDTMYMGATMSLLCGEEVDRVSEEDIANTASASFARDSYYKAWKTFCAGWKYVKPADDAYDPIISEVPALVLSGEFDPVTPPTLGEHYVQGLSSGRHIVVPGAGHNTSHISCMPDLIADFITTLDTTSFDTTCLMSQKRLPIVIGVNGTVN